MIIIQILICLQYVVTTEGKKSQELDGKQEWIDGKVWREERERKIIVIKTQSQK